MIGDFFLNLSASLTHDLLKSGFARLRQAALGNAEQEALRHLYARSLGEALTQTASSLDNFQRDHLANLLSQFISDDNVANSLLDIALADRTPPLNTLRQRFEETGFDSATLPLDFDRLMSSFIQTLCSMLREEASRTHSPLHNRLVIANLEGIRHDLRTLAELLERLESALGQRVVSIGDDISGSIIITGDGNTVTVSDGGLLAQRWQELQIGDAEAADLYRKRIADLYAHLSFPLSGLSFDTLLHEVYQPLQAAPVHDLLISR